MFRKETAILFQSDKMKKAFKNINICASVKNKISRKFAFTPCTRDPNQYCFLPFIS